MVKQRISIKPDFFNDERVQGLIGDFGVEGIGVYFWIIFKIKKTGLGSLCLTDDDVKECAEELDVKPEDVLEVIKCAILKGMLYWSKIDNCWVIVSAAKDLVKI